MITLHAILVDVRCLWYVDPAHIVSVSRVEDEGYYTIVQITTGLAVDGLRWVSPWGVAHLFARSDNTRMWWVNGPDAYIEVPKLADGLTRAGLSETNVDADHWVYEDHARAVDARVRIAQALGLDTTLTDWTAFADAVTQKAATATEVSG